MLRSTLIFAALALAGGVIPPNAHARQGTITVTIENVRQKQGVVRVGLFREGDWAGRALRGGDVQVGAGPVTVRFDDVPPGRYGIKAYHDVDGDGQLKSGAFGIPAEPFGFSNNAPARMGPASFSDSAFDVSAGDAVQMIRLR